MFLKFFGLRDQPFGVTPDPRFLYLSAAHREAVASMYYGLEANRGFLALIAKPGMGKTTILFHLLEKFRTSARTAFLFQTQCSSREFMRFLLAELGYEGDSQDFVRMHEEFNRRLLQEARAGNRLIVVIDEAQNLEPEVLETVRLLSDFETPRAKLMHIILAGQPELADKLASPKLSQLRQRISIMQGLAPLPSWEIKNYVEHRLRISGYEGNPLFTSEAYEAIARFTEGIPRNVNNFCFNALSLACALDKKVVDSEMVEEVIADLDISKLTSGFPSDAPNESAFARYTRQQEMMDLSTVPNPGPVLSTAPGNGGGPPGPVPINGKEILNPADAAAYMQQIASKLKNWQDASSKKVADAPREARARTRSDDRS